MCDKEADLHIFHCGRCCYLNFEIVKERTNANGLKILLFFPLLLLDLILADFNHAMAI